MRPQTTRKADVFSDAAACKIWRRLYVKEQRSYFFIESLLPQLQLNEKKEKEKRITERINHMVQSFLQKSLEGNMALQLVPPGG